ncbi:hypothetical protein CFC21_085441 [Triticum aestivum]|uniref:non-specific serine/threonine protein kinase n=3 Tax=Triticum aestivum TaxID=4565 RepID=A0A9R1L8M5_WHEAT|nr:hypothetical protein CFC21_085441 [Triticum aestivum]
MGPAVLFFLVLAAAAPLHLAAQTLNYSMAKPSTVWINNEFQRHGFSSRLRTIVTRSLGPETQARPDSELDVAAGFTCASRQSACNDFLFAVFIYMNVGFNLNNATTPQPQVIWSANQARPVTENATLEFTSDGNLVLCDDDGSHVWSTSSSGRSVAGMLITDIGNLVLFDQRNATVWQSFDHPTDTLVPGQSLVEGTRLTASTSAINMMNPNQFYITVLPDGLHAYAESTPPQLYYRLPWASIDKKGNDPITVTFMNESLTVSVRSDIYHQFSLPPAKSTRFMRLDSDGHLRVYEQSGISWPVEYDVMQIDYCAYPTVCGRYGICMGVQCTYPLENNSNSRHFKPVEERKPNLGSTPITPISCQEIQHHQLFTLTNISYFVKKPTVVNATSIDDCKQACLKNCSCKAVIFRHRNNSLGKCDWLTEVFSLQSIQPEAFGYSSSAYLKVQLSPTISASTSNKKRVLLVATFVAIATLVLFIIAVTLYRQRRRKYEDKNEEFYFDQFPGMPTRFSLEKLTECTRGFDKKLGEGGFGSVFEGKLGEERIAVKRLEGARQGKKEFLAEVETIGSIEHINLVSLIGFCAQKSERLLVYEYMSRGSLDRWIYYHHNNNPLDWCTRCRIILDIAKGLCYLHEECRRKIVHLDIKPQNILLDDNFNAKVADFGLCKLINRDQSKVVTVMRGTPGYLAPEWLTSRITEKVDVYSFGVVVMEIEEVIQMMKLAVWCLQNESTRRPSMSTVIKNQTWGSRRSLEKKQGRATGAAGSSPPQARGRNPSVARAHHRFPVLIIREASGERYTTERLVDLHTRQLPMEVLGQQSKSVTSPESQNIAPNESGHATRGSPAILFSGDRHDLLRRQLRTIRLWFLPSGMGPANLFILVLTTTAPLLSTSQPFNYSMARPSMVWINNASSYYDIPTVDPAVTSFVPQGANSSSGFAFAAGFVCASTLVCDVSLFAVSVVSYARNRLFLEQVVWSANRDHPVRENATLEFTSHGNLVLRDADGSHVWSSSTSGQSVAGMVISGTGNLMLFDKKNATVWQSFDHPTDTLIRGQSLLEGMKLTASASATNTTKNQFYITVLPHGLYAYVESTPPQLYFSFYYSVADHRKENDLTRVTFMNGSLTIFVQSDRFGGISLPASESNQYMKLESNGHLRLYDWDDRSILYEVMQIDDCDYPTVCGEYGICIGAQCICPYENTFFKAVDERRPHLGCTPLTPISCQEKQRHRLLALPSISYFDKNYTVVNAKSMAHCKKACLKSCSCRAIIFSYYHNDSYGECVWVTKVFSLQSMKHEDVGYNSTAYLKVQIDENKTKVMLGATLGAIGALLLLVTGICLCLKRRGKYEEKDEFDFDQLPGMLTRFSFEKLSECTEGFSKKLGDGGFGSVFQGELGEEKVAVKRLEGARQGKKEFLAEVETIGSIEHINLVRLIGFCAEKSERLLVYEYMSRGSLDRWIYYHHNNAPLDWCTRWRIILAIAKGLCYLHEECRHIIAHLDIKPQNILLDDKFNAKVADFGLCKLINRDQSKVVTMMRGTPGYLAPEWLTSRITEKVDVYSFGVVLMEIVSGRKNIDSSQPEEDVQLINMLREKAQNNHLVDLIDKHGEDMVSHKEEVIQMMKLAIWCLQQDSIRRPSMSTVIKALEGAISIETFDANSVMPVQDNPSTYSVTSQTSMLSGPR